MQASPRHQASRSGQPPRRASTSRILALALAAAVACAAAPGLSALPPAPDPVDAAELIPILGGTNLWTVAQRAPGALLVEPIDGRPALGVGKYAAAFTSREALPVDTEIVVRFRLAPGEKETASVTLDMGITNAADPKERGVYIGLSNRGDPAAIAWTALNVAPAEGQRSTLSGAYRVGFAAVRSFGWPEDVRKRIEADLAAAETVSAHWATLRAVLRKERIEFSIDGIPLLRAARPGLKTDGFARLSVSPGAQVATVAVRKLEPEDPLAVYEPILLDAVLNAGTVDGKRIGLAAGPDGQVRADGVPFVAAPADARGRNHVDLGASWLRQGNLEGRFAGDRDAFGGRWAGALERDPARIQLRVPPGRYRALHLLAVADGEADSVPVLTAQFFRPSAGFPVGFESPPVPRLGADGAAGVAATLADGGRATVYHLVVPLDPGALAWFDNVDYLDLELTKRVQLYRAYPDPLFYSAHGAGLPSSVHVFAATLERPAIEVRLAADAYGHVWTAPGKPVYTATILNRAGPARRVEVALSAAPYGGGEPAVQRTTAELGEPGTEVSVSFTLAPTRYGQHELALRVADGGQAWEETRSLAYLHADTRERGDWDFGRGPMFGFWNWGGGHGTPPGEKQLLVMGLAGAETMHGSFYEPKPGRVTDEARKVGERFRMKTYKFAGAGDHYVTAAFAGDLKTKGLEAAREAFLKTLRERQAPEDKLNHPIFCSFYAEPGIGHYTHAAMPDYYGEPAPVFSPAEEERFQGFLNGFVEGARIIKANFPQVKCLMPHGDPSFPIPFLRRSQDVRKLLDGVTVDIPCFERIPEQQIHQVSIHRMYLSRQEFKKAGIEKPVYAMYEGPCVPSGPGALTQRELADISVRDALILLAYGVDFQTGGFGGFDCTSYWGEQHYGGGILYRMPLEMPKPAYAAFATMTRALNRCNFDGWTPTGSLSAYALRFKHYQTGKPVHVFWTIRGTRPVTLAVPAGARITRTDSMDNATELAAADGRVTFAIDSSPCYVDGLPAEIAVELGEADHSDAQPAPIRRRLAGFGDGSWRLSPQPDTAYEQSHFPLVVRFPGAMSAAAAEAPAEQGGKALAVHLGKQEKERIIMPFYTTLVPARPLVVPGKASHLGVWVKAASDWGRLVYVARDAKGERWYGVGKAGAWNCDDLHNWLSFCFDGWRYLRFELPANSPYDSFREAGSTWWGSYGGGDQVVDLPLSLEKVIVERRTHAMYVNDPQPARADDVLLGDLFAEYAAEQDQAPEAVRLSALRMPVPAGAPGLENPIAKLAAGGAGAPVAISRITLPEQEADGTRCYVHFSTAPEAVTYDVWASPYPDGQGALELAKGLKGSGSLIRGFRPDMDFYLFVVYADQGGKVSKPSSPFKIRLVDLFAQK